MVGQGGIAGTAAISGAVRCGARRLAGCYAYTLGYRDSEGRLCGLRIDADQAYNDYLPIMADRPPFDQTNYLSVAAGKNSPNHDGTGQNVLYLSGRVAFSTNRTVGRIRGQPLDTRWELV